MNCRHIANHVHILQHGADTVKYVIEGWNTIKYMDHYVNVPNDLFQSYKRSGNQPY